MQKANLQFLLFENVKEKQKKKILVKYSCQ